MVKLSKGREYFAAKYRYRSGPQPVTRWKPVTVSRASEPGLLSTRTRDQTTFTPPLARD